MSGRAGDRRGDAYRYHTTRSGSPLKLVVKVCFRHRERGTWLRGVLSRCVVGHGAGRRCDDKALEVFRAVSVSPGKSAQPLKKAPRFTVNCYPSSYLATISQCSVSCVATAPSASRILP